MRLPLSADNNTFDHVFISHVISVVSDPYRLVREAQRVAKPDARIVIVNHFQSTNRFIAMVEKFLCPLCTKLGWAQRLWHSRISSGEQCSRNRLPLQTRKHRPLGNRGHDQQ